MKKYRVECPHCLGLSTISGASDGFAYESSCGHCQSSFMFSVDGAEITCYKVDCLNGGPHKYVKTSQKIAGPYGLECENCGYKVFGAVVWKGEEK